MGEIKPYKTKLLFSFLFIVVLSGTCNLFLLGENNAFRDNIFAIYGLQAIWALQAVWFILIVFTGYIAWRDHPQKWVSYLWLAFYFLGGAAICIFGFIDLVIYKFQYQGRTDISKIRIFILSPIPFAILYFLAKISNKPTTETRENENN